MINSRKQNEKVSQRSGSASMVSEPVCVGIGRFVFFFQAGDKVAWIRPPLPIGKGRKVFNLNLMDMRMGVSWQNLTEKSFYFFGV